MGVRLTLARALLLGLAPAPALAWLPSYQPGDSYVWDDGRVERVVRVEGERIHWGGLGSGTYVRHRNIVVPILQWSTRGEEGRRRIHGDPDRLWPLDRPRSVRFRVVTESRSRPDRPWVRSTALWRCETGRPAWVDVPAGRFEAVPIRCDRYSATTMRPIERISLDYAPELGHPVRRSLTSYGKATTRTTLLAATLHGPKATPERLRALARKARRTPSRAAT